MLETDKMQKFVLSIEKQKGRIHNLQKHANVSGMSWLGNNMQIGILFVIAVLVGILA